MGGIHYLIVFLLVLLRVGAQTGFCPNQLKGLCPPNIIGNYRVFEIQSTGEPVLSNPIQLDYTVKKKKIISKYVGNSILFNNAAFVGATIASIIGCNPFSNAFWRM
jgi:hypothetical protein